MTPLPWVRVIDDRWAVLYAPFEDPEDYEDGWPQKLRIHKPDILTLVDADDEIGGSLIGLDTTLYNSKEHSIVCNTLNRNTEQKMPEKYLVKSWCELETGNTMLLRHLCLTFSDMICIRSLSKTQAVNEFINWVKSYQTLCVMSNPSIRIMIDSRHAGCIDSSRFKELCVQTIKEQNIEGFDYELLDDLIQNTTVDMKPKCSSLALEDICDGSLQRLATARERRKARGHLWNLEILIKLIEKFCLTSPTNIFRFSAALRQSYWPFPKATEYGFLDDLIRNLCQKDPSDSQFLPLILANIFMQDARGLGHAFHAKELFKDIYQPLYRCAFQRASDYCELVRSKDCSELEHAILTEMENWSTSKMKMVAQLMTNVTDLPSCCICMWKTASVYLPCEHGYCEFHAWQTSYRLDQSHTLSEFSSCQLCQKSWDSDLQGFKVCLRPMQAGYRVATFDGGGIRAVVILVSLMHLTNLLPKCLNIWDIFDFGAGCSSGTIILGLCFNLRKTLPECIDLFRNLASSIFPRVPFFLLIMNLVFTGSLYSTSYFHKVLQHHLKGLDQKQAEACIPYTCIIATDSEMEPKIHRSYHSPAVRKIEVDSLAQYPLWKKIASSCSAPLYFNPVEDLQDGGWVANNPLLLARREVRHLLANKEMPDFYASFGTASFLNNKPKEHKSLLRKLMPRLAQQFKKWALNSIDPQKLYQNALLQMEEDEKQRCHRIDFTLAGPPVALNNAAAISRLQEETRAQIASNINKREFASLSMAVLASCFYPIILNMRFDRTTGPDQGLYRFNLMIVSRWEHDPSKKEGIQKFLSTSHFVVENKLYKVKTPLSIEMAEPKLSKELEVFLCRDSRKILISGLPRTFDCALKMQSPPGRSKCSNKRMKRSRPFADTVCEMTKRQKLITRPWNSGCLPYWARDARWSYKA